MVWVALEAWEAWEPWEDNQDLYKCQAQLLELVLEQEQELKLTHLQVSEVWVVWEE